MTRAKPRSVKSLSSQLQRILPDPKGDHLRSKISNIIWEEGDVEWKPLSDAPPFVLEAIPSKPTLGQYVIKVTGVYPAPNTSSVLLVYWDQDLRAYTKYVLSLIHISEP